MIKESAEAAAYEFGGKAYTDIKEITEKLDLVSITTPPNAHYKVVMEMINKKTPIFCEKPITMNVMEAKNIVMASQESRVPVGVGFKMRYEPVFVKAREYIGEIGKTVLSFCSEKSTVQ